MALAVTSCGSDESPDQGEMESASTSTEKKEDVDTMPPEPSGPPFEEVAVDYRTEDLILPEGFEYKILFTEDRDSVLLADGSKAPAKGKHDLSVYFPIDGSNHGKLYIGHEEKYKDDALGDGGGATTFEVKKENGEWNVVGPFNHVDFSNVGGTLRNCGGTATPWETVITCEESYAYRDENIYLDGKGIRDLDPFRGKPKYFNYGYLVEVDPNTNTAIRKLYNMGRFMHEDAWFAPDGKTVYMTDDYNPGIFFKFVMDQKHDLSAGKLFAYKQSEDGQSGEWIKLPQDSTSLLYIRDVAMEMGATVFIRHEWIEDYNGKLYISETGDDDFDWSKAINMGATIPSYVDRFHKSGNKYDDVFGRILEFDPATNKMRVYLECGRSVSDSSKVFSNPDCLTKVTMNGTTYLVMSEDINWYSKGRVDKETEARKMFVNELYWVDLAITEPTVDDALRFAVGPQGCETTGVIFTPDAKTMFMNIMHPWPGNRAPFNKSCTVAITGF